MNRAFSAHSTDLNAGSRQLSLAILLAFLLWCGWEIGTTIFDSLHTYGDAGAEGALLMGVRNFIRYGFIKTHFLPIHNASPTAPFEIIADWTYDRYPPGPDLIAGVIGRFAPDGVYWPFRILPTLCSLTAIYLLFRLTADVLRNAWIALFVAFAYAMNYSFMKMADSFYYTGYAELLRMLVPLAAYRWCEADPAAARRWLIVLVAASFLNVWFTFDYVPANLITSLLLVGLFQTRDLTFAGRIRRAVVAVIPIGLATVAAMFTRLIQNGWAHGSIGGALYEFYLALLHRVFNQTPNASAPLDFGNIIHVVVHRTQFSFNLNWTHILIGIALLAAVLVLAGRHPLVRRYGAFLLAMAAGNLAYMILLPAWAQEHYGIIGIRHILPTYALLIGGGAFLAIWLVVGEPGRQLAIGTYRQAAAALRTPGVMPSLALNLGHGLFRLAACGFILFAFGTALIWNFNDTRMLWRTSAQNSWAERFAALDTMRRNMPPNGVAFGNAHWFRPEARYRLDRMAAAILSLQGLRENEYWLPPGGARETFAGKVPLLPVDKFEGYFVFYQRWDKPDDGFFPNFAPADTAGIDRDRKILAWLKAHAEFIVSSGKWSLYRLTRLPTAAEASDAPAGDARDESRGPGNRGTSK